MASGGTDDTDIFKCAICLNQMLDRTPRCLQCIHSFCEPCLDLIMRNQRIICPSCSKVTKIHNSDVKELPVNFMLYQIKDMQISQQPKKCQICKVATPDFKCNNCPRLMCAACKNEHNDVKEYKGHAVFDLCHQHDDSITHMCMKCITPLCMSCMAVDHKHHKGNFEDMSEAMTGETEIMKESVKQATCQMNDYAEIIQRHAISNVKTEKELLQRKKYYCLQLELIDKLLKKTENNKKKFDGIEVSCGRIRKECEQVTSSLNVLTEGKTNFYYSKYTKLKQKAEDSVKAVQKQLAVQYDISMIELNEQKHEVLVKHIQPADISVISETIQSVSSTKSDDWKVSTERMQMELNKSVDENVSTNEKKIELNKPVVGNVSTKKKQMKLNKPEHGNVSTKEKKIKLNKAEDGTVSTKENKSKPKVPKMTRSIKLDQLVVDIPDSHNIYCTSQIDFIGSDAMLLNNVYPVHVIRLDQKGKVVNRYYPSLKKDSIYSIAVEDENIYLLQTQTITVISSRSNQITAVYKPKMIEHMEKIIVHKGQIYISNFIADIETSRVPGREGSIYQYDTKNDETKIMVRGLNHPTYLSKAESTDGIRFIVSETHEHCIRVYNDEWTNLEQRDHSKISFSFLLLLRLPTWGHC